MAVRPSKDFAAIALTPEIKQRAWAEAMAHERRLLPTRQDSRYIGKVRGVQRYEGRLGELAFMAFLDRIRIPYQEHPPVTHGGDAYDLRVMGARVDVKTSRLSTSPTSLDPAKYGFILAVEQVAKDVDLYVAVYLSVHAQQAYVAGFVRRAEVVERPAVSVGRMTHPAIRVPLAEMESPFHLPWTTANLRGRREAATR